MRESECDFYKYRVDLLDKEVESYKNDLNFQKIQIDELTGENLEQKMTINRQENKIEKQTEKISGYLAEIQQLNF